MKWDDVKMSRLYAEGLGINNTTTQGNDLGSSNAYTPKDIASPDLPGLPVTVPGEQEEIEKPVRERAGRIEKLDRQNVDDSDIYVSGFGVLKLRQLKDNVAGKFADLSQRIKNDEPGFVWKRINERHGFLMHAVKALIEIEKDIERIRRAGRIPGMIKRYNYSA
jgi:hypothetical protein